MLRYTRMDVVFQEVPDEISLLFHFAGCPLHCSGCHSSYGWSPNQGKELSQKDFAFFLQRYHSMITCVCFFGGEWEPTGLLAFLHMARQYSLKTCLYTGLERVHPRILQGLDYLKTGPWIASLGGLSSTTTNQKFIHVPSGECLNAHFQKLAGVEDAELNQARSG